MRLADILTFVHLLLDCKLFVSILDLFSSYGFSSAVVAFVVIGALTLCLFAIFRRPTAQPRLGQNMATKTEHPPPPKKRAITKSELAAATGVTANAALYIAVKDPYSERIVVFDVSQGSDFYGPGSAYHVFAGRNATHGLAKSSIDPTKVEGDLSKLTASERDTHMQWFAKYTSKYPQVGFLVDDHELTDNANENETETSGSDNPRGASAAVGTTATTDGDKKDQ